MNDSVATAKDVFDDIAVFLTELVRSHPEVGSSLIACGILASEELLKRKDLVFRVNEHGSWLTNTGLLNAAACRHELNFWTRYEAEDGSDGYKVDQNGNLIINSFHVAEKAGYPAGRPRLSLGQAQEKLMTELLELNRVAMDALVQIEMGDTPNTGQITRLKQIAERI